MSRQTPAALLVFLLRRSDHITDAIVSLHWLWVPAIIIYKIAVQTYWALHGDAPQYLQYGSSHRSPTSRLDKDCGLLHPTIYLFLLSHCLLFIGRRAFLVAGARTWNNFPTDVTSAPSLQSAHLQKTTKIASVSTFISWPSLNKLTVSMSGPCDSMLLLRPP